jgi:hypothetical protein
LGLGENKYGAVVEKMRESPRKTSFGSDSLLVIELSFEPRGHMLLETQ